METVTNVNDQKSLFSSYLEVLENKEKKLEAERELQDEKYRRRTQRIYEFHERQRRDVGDLRRCLQLVGEHAHALEAAVAAGSSPGHVPLAGTLLAQASALQRCMLQCVGDATRIRNLLSSAHHPHMDMLLAKMEAELERWSQFLSGASHALLNTSALMDNIHNLIAVQRRCVSEVSASGVFCDEERAPSAVCSTPIARD